MPISHASFLIPASLAKIIWNYCIIEEFWWGNGRPYHIIDEPGNDTSLLFDEYLSARRICAVVRGGVLCVGVPPLLTFWNIFGK